MAALCSLNLLTGCATGALTGAVSTAPDHAVVSISGTVHGGQSPISASRVQLWETGTTGYGTGAATLVASTTSSIGSGSFSFPTANVPANCTTGPSAYITATGGDPTGLTTTSTNSGIAMVAMIGSCSTTGASTQVIVNELTTVAVAYALSGFATDASGTITIGAPTTNAQGLADAVANAALLVSPTSGQANASTATMLLPTSMINTLGNALAACINTASSSATPSSSCTSLFGDTTTSASTPTDTFQAALNMAKFPGQNVPAILTLGAGTGAPFQPTVAIATVNTTTGTAPNDITLGISYPNQTLQSLQYAQYVTSSANNTTVSLAIDSADNVFVLGATNGTLDTSHYNYISELTAPSSGTPTYTNTLGSTAALDATHTVRTGAFDTLGNFFLSDKSATSGSLIEIPYTTAATSTTAAKTGPASAANELVPFTNLTLSAGSLDPNDWWVAIGQNNSLWTASYGGAGNCTAAGSGTVCDIVEYPTSASTATSASPITATFGGNQVSAYTSRGGQVDLVSTSVGLGNVWATDYGILGASTVGTSLQILTPSNGAVQTVTLGSTAARPQGVALDASGNGYITTNATTATSGLWKVPVVTASTASGSTSSTISAVVPTTGQAALTGVPTTSSTPSASANGVAIGGLNTPGYDAIDGAGRVWVANQKYGSLVEYDPTTSAYFSPYLGFSPSLNTASATTTAQQVTLFTSSGIAGANIYGPNNLTVGQTVTLSGFTKTGTGFDYSCMNGGPYTVTALGSTSSSYFVIAPSGCNATVTATVSKTATTGTVVANPSTSQATLVCSSGSCSIAGGTAPQNAYVAIDRAGTVWTVAPNGTLTAIIGTAAPTDPVLADGKAGVQP
jgi:hypothetical protein